MDETHSQFPQTRWSLISGARNPVSPALHEAAVNELCALYWRPIYGFLRRRGLGPAEAQDLTQGFFLALLEEDLFSKARSESGKMRTFLLGALQRFQRGEWRKGQAEKRGGGRRPLSFEQMTDEEGFDPPGDPSDTPEKYYERTCALAILQTAMLKLASEQDAAGKSDAFEVLRPLLAPVGSNVALSQEAAAAKLRLTPEALRVTLHRLRKRYAELLRESVAETLADPDEESVAREMQALRIALS